MPKPLLTRNEYFGKSIYDPNTFRHYYASDSECAEFIRHSRVRELDNDCINAVTGIIYSPIRVYFDLTSQCNLTCKTCLNRSGNAMFDELSIRESIRVVEGMHRDSVFEIRFSGGEPTLKRGWHLIMARSQELGLVTSLNSNGVYDGNTLDKLIKIRPEETTISLDGYREGNDHIRGKGMYQRAVDSIRELSAAGCRVTINTVITGALCERDIRGLLDLTSKYCADISFFHIRPFGRATDHKDLHLNYAKLCKYYELIDKIMCDYPEARVRTRSSSLRRNSIGVGEAMAHGLLSGGADGFTRLNILPNGDIFAGGCVPYVDSMFREQLLLGNILQEDYSVLNVWRGNQKLCNIRGLSSKLAAK
ncbi:hypothetical protein LCGC14_2691510, partial [marine sediment metagenome]